MLYITYASLLLPFKVEAVHFLPVSCESHQWHRGQWIQPGERGHHNAAGRWEPVTNTVSVRRRLTICWRPRSFPCTGTLVVWRANCCASAPPRQRFSFGFLNSEYFTSTPRVFALKLFPHQTVWIIYRSRQLCWFVLVILYSLFLILSSSRQSPDDPVRYTSHHHLGAGPLAGTLGLTCCCECEDERWRWQLLLRGSFVLHVEVRLCRWSDYILMHWSNLEIFGLFCFCPKNIRRCLFLYKLVHFYIINIVLVWGKVSWRHPSVWNVFLS